MGCFSLLQDLCFTKKFQVPEGTVVFLNSGHRGNISHCAPEMFKLKTYPVPPFKQKLQIQTPTWMSQESSKWLVNGLFHLLIHGVYWGYNPLILTSWDIQVGSTPLRWYQVYLTFFLQQWRWPPAPEAIRPRPKAKGGTAPWGDYFAGVVCPTRWAQKTVI